MPAMPENSDHHSRSLTEAQLVERMVKEITAYDRAIEFGISPLNAFELAGVLQLALRHPGVAPRIRRTAAVFIKHVRFAFRQSPAVSELLRRGYDGAGCITCPHCGMLSTNPNDVGHRYCGACHRFADAEDQMAGLN
jgi:hypothetical protein